ncbi:MAG: hypothetical protein JJ850_02530 [Kordiimonadaceae bacterium]|nr:hypothetical protein [Kordiimonadaceae bacterium]MBO6567318.1 hypothetical protein [Kordiimonadaceae bacterium]MBO6963468.1 hypothetical protein [Kordiimonadaceae bacterium]
MNERRPSLASIAAAAALDRPRYFEDPKVDDLLALLLEVAEENCVLVDRLKTAELLSPGLSNKIDELALTDEETADRLADHSQRLNALMAKVANIIE